MPHRLSQQCANCLYWMQSIEPNQGECHRHAPRPLPQIGTDDKGFLWPVTGASDWCGQWNPEPVGNEGARKESSS